jgi:CHAD domain-containing protein
MLRLLRWFVARGWRDQQISEHAVVLLAPIVDVAPDLIQQHHRKACKRSKRFDELTATQRHKLRIALKHLHYIVEFLGSLFDEASVRTFVKCLKSLRDDLGYTNDVRVAHDLVDEIGEATNQDVSAINRAGGIVLGWHERVLALAIRRSESMFVALDDWIRSGERKNGGWWFVWEVRPAPMCGFSSPWRVGWQERFHARTQPARRTAG